MKNLALSTVFLLMSNLSFATQTTSLESIKGIVCQELSKNEFEVDGECLQEVHLDKETNRSYVFFAQDVSGDCGATVIVNKKSLKKVAKIFCY